MAGICGLRTSSATLSHLMAAAPPLLCYLVTSRFYATSAFAAAQPQLDPDYYYYYNQQNESQAISDRGRMRSSPMVDSEGLGILRGIQWLFIGYPGAKKHVYAEKLSKLLDVPHISIGSLVRQDLSPRSSLYKQIANAVNQGKLVPEEIIFGLLSKRLEDGFYNGETGYILDGIPRTRIQAEILDKLVEIDLVVNFKCAEDCLLEQHGDSLISHPHQSDRICGSACANDIVTQDTRSDYSFGNSESAFKGKAHIHAKQRKPLEDYYKKQKKLIDFQVHSAPGETWQGLLAALRIQHINAAHSRLTSGSSWL